MASMVGLELTNLARAWAMLQFRDGPLLKAISAASLARISQFDTQNLANTAWA